MTRKLLEAEQTDRHIMIDFLAHQRLGSDDVFHQANVEAKAAQTNVDVPGAWEYESMDLDSGNQVQPQAEPDAALQYMEEDDVLHIAHHIWTTKQAVEFAEETIELLSDPVRNGTIPDLSE